MTYGVSWTNNDGELAFSDSSRRITFQRKVTASHAPVTAGTLTVGYFSIPTGETNSQLPPIVFCEVVTGSDITESASPIDLQWNGSQWLLNCGTDVAGGTGTVVAYIFNLDLGVATGSDWGIETYNADSEVSFTTKGNKPLLAVAKVDMNRGPDSGLGFQSPVIGTASATLPAGAIGLGKLATNIMACTRGDTFRFFIAQASAWSTRRYMTPITRSDVNSSTIQTENKIWHRDSSSPNRKLYSVMWRQKWAICIDGDMYS